MLALALGLVLAVGCSANYKSIYRHNAIDDEASITTIDAKQRAILSNTYSEKDKNNDENDDESEKRERSIRRFCSEPSPDVYSVVAQALSAGGAFGKSADPTSIEAAFNVAFADAEQGSTIPRTQTINMLRELMFNTCVRHLNGAYTDLEMSIQAVRDQRLMVSILAIEQITGPVSPKPVVIGATSTAESGAGGVAIVRLDDALKARNAAAENHKKADKAFNDLNGDAKECDAIAAAVEKKEELTNEQKEQQPKCDEARTALASATDLLSKKNDHYADLKRLAATAGIATSTELSAIAQGGIDRAHTESIKDVLSTVDSIVARNFDNDTEVLLFCIRVLPESLSLKGVKNPTSIQTTCMEYLENQTALESQRTKLLESKVTLESQTTKLLVNQAALESEKTKAEVLKLREEIEASEKQRETVDRNHFDRQWPTLQQILIDSDTKAAFIAALKEQLLPNEGSLAECFDGDKSKDENFACFSVLRADLKQELPGLED